MVRMYPGQRDLFLDELGADFYTGNGHKWLLCPKDTAFLYVRPEKQELIEPMIVGYGWQSGERSETPLVSYVEQFGTRDLANSLSVPATIDYMEAHDWPQVRARCCHAMALPTKQTLEERSDSESICPIRLPDNVDIGRLGQILREEYQIEMSMISWKNVKIARLSIQVYTSQDEFDTFVEAVTIHLPACQNDDC